MMMTVRLQCTSKHAEEAHGVRCGAVLDQQNHDADDVVHLQRLCV